MTENRRFDLVLFGATGFTGKLVAEYLARHHPRHLRWAIAGRDPKKLTAVQSDLARIDPTLAEIEILTADSQDRTALNGIAQAARVVVSTVGPYMRYGRELVAACAEHGTHYADLTGEVPFVRESIEHNHAKAKDTGARIVHCAGFDSIPSDLGVFMLHRHFASQGRRLSRAWFFVEAVKGGASGGTVASMTTILEAATRDRQIRSLMTNPYALVPGTERGPAVDSYRIRFEPRLGKWVCPFLMAAINTRVVHRSNSLSGYAYGRDFLYSEEMCTGRGAKGLARATAISGGLGAVAALSTTSPGRRLLHRFQPAPGEGPSEQERDAGFFKIRVIGEGLSSNGGLPALADAEIHGHRDPGYGETALMLGESALCLALDALESPGGVLTPSIAMGEHLVGRLCRAGMNFDVTPRLTRDAAESDQRVAHSA